MSEEKTEAVAFVRRWLAELRSGRHRQVRGQLHDGLGGVCAMGVAYEWESGPKALARLLELRSLVVRWNDRDAIGFPEIADRIEHYAVQHGIFDIPAALARAGAEARPGVREALAFAEAQAALNEDLGALQAVGV